MHPIICKIGPVVLYSYGLMLAIAVMVTSWLVARDASAKLKVKRDDVYDLVFWVVLGGIIGARIFYVFLNLALFSASPIEIIMIHKGGLAWQGSFIVGLAVAVVYLRKKKIPVLRFFDIAAPYLALGHAIGRIGCFLNGCCYGKAAAWGIYFPVWEERLIPTQLFMSAGQVAIFFILRALQPGAKRDGQVFVWYLMLSSVERFVVEFFRADHDLYGGLSIFQYVCIGIFIAALIVHARLERPTNLRK